MSKKRPPVALIAGPTASGKSALAIRLAKKTNGVIINADSAQVYRDLPILSAAPTDLDLAEAEHRLYGFRDGARPCSAAEWAKLAREQILEVQCENRLPILVGGTGLYLRTLLEGIAPIPPIDPAIREEVRSRPVEINRRELASLDPKAAAKLHASDTTRVARALEVVRSTGQTLSHWQQEKTGGIGKEVDLRAIILLPPRDWLYSRCDARFRAMMQLGAIDEVKRLLARRLDPALPVMRAIGVPEITALLRGQCSQDEAIEAGAQSTRRYAKRQYTWFSHQPPSQWPRMVEPLDEHLAVDEALALLVERP